MNTDRLEVTPSGAQVWSQSTTLFQRWRTGDALALDELVRALSPVLWQVVRAYRLDHGQAEDAVQSTWLALVRNADAISEPAAVGSWLTTTARREAWRQARRARQADPLDDDVLERSTPAARSAEATALERDAGNVLWAGVSQLSERCQRLLRVIAFSDRPDYAALAADLGMPVGSIGPTRGRCLDKLKTLLQEPDKEVPRGQ
ncbi:RNA polymerase sigma factor [Leekyejoonella antrihumi]|uniref:Sigma-70 family RNA polymerase sigma factor n=1 Tax=Leekyejoonella antrihumi TaxID=1660198 RepID=A0A563E8Q4_9MICO|nr:sigma-70 family RNA polymerase sigma factor [Leekyejoonella antrihumi]TWP38194.1 sigma-70 family RNA polymerase sigma factor [Leekyejoonella antrihumi]